MKKEERNGSMMSKLYELKDVLNMAVFTRLSGININTFYAKLKHKRELKESELASVKASIRQIIDKLEDAIK